MTTVQEHLNSCLARGEECWRDEVQRLVVEALRTGSATHEAFWRDLTKDYDWLDWDQLKLQAQPSTPKPDRLIAEALKSQMPGIQSQAQYDAAVGVLEGVRLVINALLEVDRTRELESRKALELSFDAVRKATELTLKLKDSPEAASSAAAQQFKEEPAQFKEAEIQVQLLDELSRLNSVEALNNWYLANKVRREKLVTQSVRNELLDKVRAKRNALGG
jgi:hypothetical protein